MDLKVFKDCRMKRAENKNKPRNTVAFYTKFIKDSIDLQYVQR